MPWNAAKCRGMQKNAVECSKMPWNAMTHPAKMKGWHILDEWCGSGFYIVLKAWVLTKMCFQTGSPALGRSLAFQAKLLKLCWPGAL
jgi:hypothetical protein